MKGEVWYSDEKIIEFLSGKVFLDGPAAKSLFERGFGKYLGVDVQNRRSGAPFASTEVIYPSVKVRPLPGEYEIVPLSDKVKNLSDVFSLAKGEKKELLCPGVTSFVNELGGTVVVCSGNSDMPYDFGVFSFINETRKSQFASILREIGELPVYYPDDAEIYLYAARNEDNKLFCAVLNPGLDILDDFALVCENDVTSAHRLMPDGSYEHVPVKKIGERVEFDLALNPYEPLILCL